jgi:hypothetical protein
MIRDMLVGKEGVCSISERVAVLVEVERMESESKLETYNDFHLPEIQSLEARTIEALPCQDSSHS